MIQLPRPIVSIGLSAFGEALMKDKQGAWLSTRQEVSSYIPSLFAGCVALALFGTSPIGLTAGISFVAIPLLCKTISVFTETESVLHKAVLASGHLIRLAARVANIAFTLMLAWPLPPLLAFMVTTSLGFYLIKEAVVDGAETIMTGLTEEHFWRYRRLAVRA